MWKQKGGAVSVEQKLEGTPVFPCLPSSISSSVGDTRFVLRNQLSRTPHEGFKRRERPASHAGQGPDPGAAVVIPLPERVDRLKTECTA
ncbi:unnamed protein product [Rangifer tarandus platyrhynchus]|uniref:Uncharacterized protein n=1 Tax=Rangifer tarandus platyrhynchus TaxID=3082113 RepID=A0AC59YB96_RANTA